MQSNQDVAYSKFNVLTTALAAAITAVIMVILSLPIHLMRGSMYVRMDAAHPWRPDAGPGSGMMQPQMLTSGFFWGFILVGLLIVIVYAGVGGAIFASIYNVLLSKAKR